MEYEAKGSRPRERPKRTWKEVVREDCQARKLNKEYAMDCCKWRKVIKEVRWPGWVWAGECFFWYRPTRVVPDKRPLNGCCCCCADLQWKRLKNIHVGHTTAYIYLPRMLLQMILCKRTTTIITKSFMTTFRNKLVILGLFLSIQKVDTVKSANHTVYKLTSPQRKTDISNKTLALLSNWTVNNSWMRKISDTS